MKKTKKKIKHVPLRWFNPKTKIEYSAGIGFWNTETGIYSLKVDIFSRMRVKLVPKMSNDDEIYYSVFLQKGSKNKTKSRLIGEGISSKKTNGMIFMKIAPFENTLILGKNYETKSN